jgi:hypothetical protein
MEQENIPFLSMFGHGLMKKGVLERGYARSRVTRVWALDHHSMSAFKTAALVHLLGALLRLQRRQ